MIFGSVSTTTMRNEDLIPCFLDVLKELDEKQYDEILGDKDYYYVIELQNYDSETAHFLLEELFNRLNELAPAGFYFGSHPGNGADYGFWLDEKWSDMLYELSEISENDSLLIETQEAFQGLYSILFTDFETLSYLIERM